MKTYKLNSKSFIIALMLFMTFSFSSTLAAKNNGKHHQVDTVAVMSKSMERNIKNVVIVPADYNDPEMQNEQYAVLYLLHGYSGAYDNWIKKKPELEDLASEHSVIIVCPDGQDSWYLDSPIDPKMQFETYITKELVSFIDNNYRTIADPKFRAITGLSMGGHGAMSLALKHPDIYWQCGSMSGGLDIVPFPLKWKIKDRLGKYEDNQELWKSHSVVGIAEGLESTDQRIIFDCGMSDFMYEVNEKLHNVLLDKKIAHDYITRPGNHSWKYWCNSIDFQMLYFSKGFAEAAAKTENAK